MLLALDVGNTDIKFGLFNGKELVNSWKFSNKDQTSDEMGLRIYTCLKYLNMDFSVVDGIIISSVRPSVNFTLEHTCKTYFHIDPIFVEAGVKTGINVQYDNPKELGPDRIINAVAAREIYGAPCITVDFGTATTYGVINEKGAFIGGLISPGLKISLEALAERAAMLPKIEFIKPKTIINKSTVKCMQSGLINGYIGQVDYILRKIKEELGLPNVKVIATGGMATLIADDTDQVDVIDSILGLRGLQIIYDKNKK